MKEGQEGIREKDEDTPNKDNERQTTVNPAVVLLRPAKMLPLLDDGPSGTVTLQ